MLKKLIAHEWKDTWIVGTVCCGVLVVLSLIGAIIFGMDAWTNVGKMSDTMQAWAGISMGLYMVLLYLGVFASAMVVAWYFFYRYYKHLFTDQGYLMQTLPVTSRDLILSKLIVAVIWQYLISIAIGISMIILFGSMFSTLGDFTDIGKLFSEIAAELKLQEIAPAIPLIIIGILIILIAPISTVLMQYTAIGIGQTSKKNKLLMAVLVMIGLNMALQFVMSYGMIPITLTMPENPSLGFVTCLALLALVVIAAAGVGLFFASKYFIDKKLNLE